MMIVYFCGKYLCKVESIEQVKKVGVVVGDERASSDDRLLTADWIDVRRRQRPEEPGQSVDVTTLCQRLAHSRHLFSAKQRPRRQHPRNDDTSRTCRR